MLLESRPNLNWTRNTSNTSRIQAHRRVFQSFLCGGLFLLTNILI